MRLTIPIAGSSVPGRRSGCTGCPATAYAERWERRGQTVEMENLLLLTVAHKAERLMLARRADRSTATDELRTALETWSARRRPESPDGHAR